MTLLVPPMTFWVPRDAIDPRGAIYTLWEAKYNLKLNSNEVLIIPINSITL